MALEIFKLVGSIFVDTNEAEKSIGKTDEKAQSVGKTLSSGIETAAKWGAAIVAGATAAVSGVVALSSKAVESYADYEQLIGGIETLFGESADVIKGYAESAYKDAGMTANEYMETVTSFSASLIQSMGGDTAAAAEKANTAITDMSDNANKMGSSIESIQNAYSGFAKQNYTMLDNLKLGYSAGKAEMERLVLDAEKLDSTFRATRDENDKLAMSYSEIVDAIHIVQTEMGITGTTASEAGSTISGMVSMIKSKFEDFKVSIGESLAPTVKEFLKIVIENLPKIENLIMQIAPAITNLFSSLLPPLLELINNQLPVMIDMFNQLLPIFQDIAVATLPVIVEMMTTLIPPIMELCQSLLPVMSDLFTALMPIFQDIVKAILPVIVQLIQEFVPPLVQIVQKLLPPLLDLVKPLLELLDPIIKLLQPILDLIIALLDPIANLITNLITPLIDIIVKLIEVALVPLEAIFTQVSERISNVMSTLIEYLLTAFDTMKGMFDGFITFITGVFTGNWSQAWEGIAKILTSIWDGLVGTFKNLINFFIGGINSFIEGINAIEIPDWIPGIGGLSLNIPTIPTLAEGGILEKGQTGLLEGNGAEAVVPLHNNKKWISAVAEDMEQGGIGGNTERLEALMSDILKKLDKVADMDIVLDTGAMVGNLARPMDKALGTISARKVRA